MKSLEQFRANIDEEKRKSTMKLGTYDFKYTSLNDLREIKKIFSAFLTQNRVLN